MIGYEYKVYDNNILLDEITDILRSGGEVVLKARGSSMNPFIRNDIDSVLLKRVDEYRVSDIVLANIGIEEHHYVLHRIISINADKVTLMGDGNCSFKEYCTMKDISGKVLSIIRPSGRSFKAPKARSWQLLRPVRRPLLAIYRRLPDFIK